MEWVPGPSGGVMDARPALRVTGPPRGEPPSMNCTEPTAGRLAPAKGPTPPATAGALMTPTTLVLRVTAWPDWAGFCDAVTIAKVFSGVAASTTRPKKVSGPTPPAVVELFT